MYLDANNLYGWAMSQYLPYSRVKWLSKKEISRFCLNSHSENSSVDYILEVGIEYPIELHDLQIDYPLASEKLEISQDMLSKYCYSIVDKYGINTHVVNKSVPNLGDEKRYFVHYRNLQLYLRFKQSIWLKTIY